MIRLVADRTRLRELHQWYTDHWIVRATKIVNGKKTGKIGYIDELPELEYGEIIVRVGGVAFDEEDVRPYLKRRKFRNFWKCDLVKDD